MNDTITFQLTYNLTLDFKTFKETFNMPNDEQYDATWKELVKQQSETKYEKISMTADAKNGEEMEKLPEECGFVDYVVCKVKSAQSDALYELNRKYCEELKKIMEEKK